MKFLSKFQTQNKNKYIEGNYMGFIFNPVPPPHCEDETDIGYLNAIDDYIDEMWLKEQFEKLLDKEREDASS